MEGQVTHSTAGFLKVPFMDGLRILVTSSGVHRACRMTVVGCSCVSQLPLAAGACSSYPYHSTYIPKLPYPAGASFRMAWATHPRLPATAVLWSAGARSQARGVHPSHSTNVPPEAAASGRRPSPYGFGNAFTLACHRRSVVCGRTQPSLRRPSLALRALSTRQPHPSHARSRINRAVDAQALEVLVTSPLRVRAEHPKRPWCASPPIRVLVTAP